MLIHAYCMNQHASSLRLGRFSESGRIYLVTTVTEQRSALFVDFALARRVVRELQRSDQRGRCRTLAFVLMPDHLHWLLELREGELSALIAQFKASSAAAMNRQLGTTGVRRWQRGFHDHAVRAEEDLLGLTRNVVANPLRAQLVKRVGDYPHWDAMFL